MITHEDDDDDLSTRLSWMLDGLSETFQNARNRQECSYMINYNFRRDGEKRDVRWSGADILNEPSSGEAGTI